MEIIIVFFALPLTLSLASPKPVSMLIALDGMESNLVHVNFYNDTFKHFYNCMAQDKVYNCNLRVDADHQKPYEDNDQYVTRVDEENELQTESDNNYFTCLNNIIINHVECVRHTQGLCNGPMHQSFCARDSYHQSKCVTILWPSIHEHLVYNSSTDKIDECTSSCASTSGIHPTTSLTGPTETHSGSASLITSTETPNNNNSLFTSTEANNNTYVIAGIVCGVVAFVILLSVLGIFVWRRRSSSVQKHGGESHAEINSKFANGYISNKHEQTGTPQGGISCSNSPKVPHILGNSNIENKITVAISGTDYYTIEYTTGSKNERGPISAPERLSNKMHATEHGSGICDNTLTGYENTCSSGIINIDSNHGYSTVINIKTVRIYPTSKETESNKSHVESVNDSDGYSTAEDIDDSIIDHCSAMQSGIYSKVHHIDDFKTDHVKYEETGGFSKAGDNHAIITQTVKHNSVYSNEIDANYNVENSLATNVKSLQETNDNSELSSIYTRLGEQVEVMTNPYDSLLT